MVVAAGGMAARSALLAMLTNVFEPLLCQDLSRCTGRVWERIRGTRLPCQPFLLAICLHRCRLPANPRDRLLESMITQSTLSMPRWSTANGGGVDDGWSGPGNGAQHKTIRAERHDEQPVLG